MLRICAPPQHPEVGLTFEKDFISPVFDSDCLSFSHPVDGLQSSLCFPSTVSLPSQEDLASFDSPQMFHWFSADRWDPKAVNDMGGKKPTPHGDIIGEDQGYWSEPFASYDSDEAKVSLYGLRSHSAPQSQESLVPQTKGDFHTTPVSGDMSLSLAQPAPKPPGLYMLNHTLTPFASCKNESATISPLATPGVPQEEQQVVSPLQGPAPTNVTIDAGPLYQRSAEESSVATVDSDFTSIGSTCGPATPLPWSSFGPQPQWEMSSQGHGSQTDPVWLTTPHASSINPAYGPSSTGLGHFPAVNDALHGIPGPSVEDPRYITPAVSMDLYRPEYPLTDKSQIMEKQGVSPFHMSTDAFPFCENQYRLNQYVVPNATMDRDLFPAERSGKAPWQRDTKNAFLIECKRRGLSYKDIKRIGGFKEAESTLRGRFRTLTKSKEQRVRKPQWHEKDIKLLCEAVQAYSESDMSATVYASWCRPRPPAITQPPKVSWKKVAQYIWTHGGSYHFGNATCKRKWCEVHNVKI